MTERSTLRAWFMWTAILAVALAPLSFSRPGEGEAPAEP